MAKKMILVLVLASVAVGGAFAEWYNSYAPGIDSSKIFVNAGVGLGFASGYGAGIPPISVAADFKLPVAVPITLGVLGTFSTWSYENSYYKQSISNIGVGARGNYHFGFIKNLDVYAGLTLGYVIVNTTGESKIAGVPYSASAAASWFLYGGQIGARYFFTDMVGVYLEVGYSGLQVGGIGLTLKF